jgi:hypothetical protein
MEVLSCHFPRETDDNYDKPQSGHGVLDESQTGSSQI